VRNERVSTFSRGMQQRLGLARVVLPSPEVLVLDEPYNALDADGSVVLDGVLDEFEGRTFVVATHDPARVEQRATQFLAFA
jgi:ATPase subunit of ABC transporter with duplicated ATPase domains